MNGTKTILIVDDNTEIRENLEEILTLAGYQAITAENGKLGVEKALTNKPDLIVCDIMMPGLDGHGVLHLVRKNVELANIPFIFLTAKAERTDFRKGMELGADDYITKPFDDLELLTAIETRLRKMEQLGKGSAAAPVVSTSGLLNLLDEQGRLTPQAEMYEQMQLSKKHFLYQEGKRPKYLYFLKEGKVKTYRVHPDGKEYITNLYSEGDYIGYLSLLEQGVYDENAEVLEEATVVLIPKDDFMNALISDHALATAFIKRISHSIRDKEERLLHLAYDSLRKRVAKALVDIHEKFNGDDEQQSIIISREDIAQYVGTATESLIRTLSDFKGEHLIEIKEGKVRITNLHKLKNLLY